MKIKSEYVQNVTANPLFVLFGSGMLHHLETIGGVAFHNKKELITYTQGFECDWVSNITGPIQYKKLSCGHYEFCLEILEENMIPFFIQIYLVNERSEWILATTPWE